MPYRACVSTPQRHAPLLLVENNEDVREALREILESEGYRVHTAVNGHDALSVLAKLERMPALILLDLVMPVMDGHAFIEHLRGTGALALTRVLVLTAHPTLPLPQGVSGRLGKPVKLEALLDAIAVHSAPE
ncbi:response regulator [Corallococcus carmarthensis]|uniref:response regulator n=1 Tax=Corallococcus carmarthensis TaxID=2316728 RepID=UPI00131592C1|nr:response regulator [Corallococcus carmarthensis]NOK18706.1 response regulator [Corallococcus carmarthensis]